MKGLISEWGGTRQGVLYALTSLGYDKSYIEPFSVQDPERWAEFIIFLKGSKQSGVYNLDVIDAEVRKVKQGSSKPAYGMETGAAVVLHSRLEHGFSDYPRCGQLVCGVWPHVVSEGYLLASKVTAQGGKDSGDVQFPKSGTFTASEEFYHFGNYTIYEGLASDIAAISGAESGVKEYLRCSDTARCSSTTQMRGGSD